jgi:general secretion pathway protein C
MVAPLVRLPFVRPVLLLALVTAAAGLATIPPPTALRPWAPRWRDAAIRCRAHHCEVDRLRVRALLETPAGIASAARFVPSIGCGRMTGIRLYAVRPASLLARLGLRNGDKVLRVNGISLSSPETAMRLFSMLKTAHNVVLNIERAGRPLALTYTIH